MTHKVQVEYGNVGVDFKYVPREGFGWMNASYQIGLSILSKKMRRALGTCTNPEIFFEKSALLQQQQKSTSQDELDVEKVAKAITENGQTTAAITVIVPPESSIIIHGSFNSNNLARMKDNVPSLSPENSINNIASVATSNGQNFNNSMHGTVNTILTPDDDESITDYFL